MSDGTGPLVVVTDAPAARVLVTDGVLVPVDAPDTVTDADCAAETVALFVRETTPDFDAVDVTEAGADAVALTNDDLVTTTDDVRLGLSDGDAKDADPDGDVLGVALVDVDSELNVERLLTADVDAVGRTDAVIDAHVVVETVAQPLAVARLLPHADDDAAVDSEGSALADAHADGESDTSVVSVALGAADSEGAVEPEKDTVRVSVARIDTVAAALCVGAIVDDTQAEFDSVESAVFVAAEGDALVDEQSVAVFVTDALAVTEAETSALAEGDVDGVADTEGAGDPDGDTVPTLALADIVTAGDRVPAPVTDGVPDPLGLRVTRVEPDLDAATEAVTDMVWVASELADVPDDADTDSVANADAVPLSVDDSDPVRLVVDDAHSDARALRVRLPVALTADVGDTLVVTVALTVDVSLGEPVDDTDDGALCDALGDRDGLADSLALADAADDALATDADADLLA